MVRLEISDKSQRLVKCPDCKHVFYTTKKGDIQCKNGHYFDTRSNQVKA